MSQNVGFGQYFDGMDQQQFLSALPLIIADIDSRDGGTPEKNFYIVFGHD